MHAWRAACRPQHTLTCESLCQDAELAPIACPTLEFPSALALSLQGRRASRFMAGPSTRHAREIAP